jgi:uncharacterized membrane protein
MSRALPFFLVLSLVSVAVLRVISVWARLPPAMASHFGPSGRPDAFMGRGEFLLVFAGLGGGVTLLLLGMPALLKVMPASWINLPNRDYWLAPERRKAALSRLGNYLAWFSVALAAFLLGVLELVLQANLQRAALANGPFVSMLLAFFAAAIALLAVMQRGFRVPPS